MLSEVLELLFDIGNPKEIQEWPSVRSQDMSCSIASSDKTSQ